MINAHHQHHLHGCQRGQWTCRIRLIIASLSPHYQAQQHKQGRMRKIYFRIGCLLAVAFVVSSLSIPSYCVSRIPRHYSSSTTTSLGATGGGWTQSFGNSALRQVENLASRVADSTAQSSKEVSAKDTDDQSKSDVWTGSDNVFKTEQQVPSVTKSSSGEQKKIWTALASLERDS